MPDLRWIELAAFAKLPVWVHEAAAVVTIVSLIVTIYVAQKVRNISLYYKQLGQTPRLKSRVATSIRNLKGHIDRKDETQIQVEAAQIIAVTDSVQLCFRGTIKSAAKKAKRVANGLALRHQGGDKVDPDDLITQLQILESLLSEHAKRREWELR